MFTGIALLVCLLMATASRTQTIREILQRYWSGTASQYAYFIERESLYTSHNLSLTYYDDNTVTGTSTVKMNLVVMITTA